MICLKRRIFLPRLAIAQRLAELYMLKENEVSDAKLFPIQVALIAQILDKLVHILEAIVCRVRLLHFPIALLHEGQKVLDRNALQLINPASLLRRLPEQLRLEFLRDKLLHSVRLGNLELAVNQVGQVHKVEHLLLVDEPVALPDHVRFLFERDARVVEHVTCGVGPGTAPQIPVAQD